MPGSNIALVVNNIEIKDAGNYTCTKTLPDGKKESFVHELEIITFPIYKVKFSIFYAVNDTCSLTDGDLLYSYLPKLVSSVLCGDSAKTCTVDVQRPRCFVKVNICHILINSKNNSE